MSERLRMALLLLIPLFVFGNSLPNKFTLDDPAYIAHNPAVTNPSLSNIFEPHRETNVFRPLTFATFALNWAVGGGHESGFHILNVLLNAGVALMLYLVLRKLFEGREGGGSVAWVASLLFAVHPLHVEAVTSIVGRSELLAAGFLFTAWLFHLQDLTPLSLSCFVLALMSKESAVGFIFLILAGDYATGKLKPLRRYAFVASITAVYVLLLWKLQGGRFGYSATDFTSNPLAKLPVALRILNAIRVAWKYIGLQIFPYPLSCDYSYNSIPLYATWRHLAPALVAALAAVALWGWAFVTRRNGWFLAGAIYLAGFVVTANILMPVGTIMGERLVYLPSAGFCVLVALLWFHLKKHQTKLAWPLLVLCIMALSTLAVLRNRDWRDNATLLFTDVKAVPANVRIHDSLVGEYLARGQLDAASAESKLTLRLYPPFPSSLKTLGVAEYDFRLVMMAEQLFMDGNKEDALEFLSEAITNSPGFSQAWSDRATIYYQNGQNDAARADAQTALRLDPANMQAQYLIGVLSAPAHRNFF